MLLDDKLAQQIVDRTMKIIGTNINVMDQYGIIISSGDSLRIGQIHDGALLAINHGDTVEITEQSSHGLKGVKPGINLLLKYNQEIIGVVGITGNPDDIRNYAAMVKMTSELIIERSLLIEQLQWDKRHVEEFISSWVNGELEQDELNHWAQRLNLSLTDPRVAVVIEVQKNTSNDYLTTIRKIVDLLEFPQRNNLVAVIAMNEIVVLKPCKTEPKSWSHSHESQRIDELLMQLTQHDIDNVKISLGQFYPNLNQVPLSYQSAKQVLSLGKKHDPFAQKYLFEDFRIPVLLTPLTNSWQGEQLSQSIIKLKQWDKSGQLMKTLYSLFEHQGNLKHCSENLYIHRNTLRYRLNKIEEITQISPHTFNGLVELYIAAQITK
ncbi:sugar diacid recognition domain-containing protein [Vibrio casei]|uniref:CdaR family transcriptional regulator n=1 Tax=Vibrio casei TaxID=673372 RepID=A0A368LPH7_9VIBR|nr:sugar diacid recognition domain-containing protein [Vibrio casei]RCS73738.1 CdaR family transcriptional regulator [Vibrio casei]SJN34645.1 Sugar diacid utilization regulator SdaR [Vibrio casei]